MPKFIVVFQSYETGEDVRVTVEAANAQAAIDSTATTHPSEYYAWCFVTTEEEERAMNHWYSTEFLDGWDEQGICVA